MTIVASSSSRTLAGSSSCSWASGGGGSCRRTPSLCRCWCRGKKGTSAAVASLLLLLLVEVLVVVLGAFWKRSEGAPLSTPLIFCVQLSTLSYCDLIFRYLIQWVSPLLP